MGSDDLLPGVAVGEGQLAVAPRRLEVGGAALGREVDDELARSLVAELALQRPEGHAVIRADEGDDVAGGGARGIADHAHALPRAGLVVAGVREEALQLVGTEGGLDLFGCDRARPIGVDLDMDHLALLIDDDHPALARRHRAARRVGGEEAELVEEGALIEGADVLLDSRARRVAEQRVVELDLCVERLQLKGPVVGNAVNLIPLGSELLQRAQLHLAPVVRRAAERIREEGEDHLVPLQRRQLDVCLPVGGVDEAEFGCGLAHFHRSALLRRLFFLLRRHLHEGQRTSDDAHGRCNRQCRHF